MSNQCVARMSNFDLQEQITTQLGTKSIRSSIEEIGFTQSDFEGFSKSMLIAYIESLNLN